MTVWLSEDSFRFNSHISHAIWLLTDRDVQHQPPGFARQPSHQQTKVSKSIFCAQNEGLPPADQAVQVSILRSEESLAASRLSYPRPSKQA